MNGPGRFNIEWVNRGGPPKQPANTAFPHGKDVDLTTSSTQPFCTTPLPYPTGKGTVGGWLVSCLTCGLRVYITAASRPDDPCSAKLPCKRIVQ